MVDTFEREIIEKFGFEQDERTGRREPSFVRDNTKDPKSWWSPPKLGGNDVAARSAEWILGEIYGLEFIAYLRQACRAGVDFRYDLAAVVEAMTTVPLDAMQKGFLMSLSEALAGAPTHLLCLRSFDVTSGVEETHHATKEAQ